MMTQYLRRPAVSQRYGVPASTLYDWIGKGQFPRGEQLGPRVVAWAEADLDAWDAARKADLEGAAAKLSA
jgi:predicted DNA-binding transcriptional regulator AlpA